jgi:uncharacterized membrane protein
MKTVVALYDDIGTARDVVAELIENGFDREDISLVARNFDSDGTVDIDSTPVDETAEGAAVGALSGGMVGGLAGLLVGLGALAIPGIGPIVAAGPIFTALTGAGIGAATGGVLGALVGLGVPEDHVEYYAEGIRRGGTLVAVKAEESWVNTAEEVINRHHPVDVERRSGYWRESGWEGFNAENDVYTKSDYQKDLDRHQAYNRDFYDYVPDFRTHFDTNYGGSGYVYGDYEPIYYYGYRLATEDDYQDYDEWDGLEVEAREGWNKTENTLGRAWDDVKDTVRHAWESVKDALDGDDDYDFYDADFRRHYMSNYRSSGNDYAYYEPGYRYGHQLAYNERFDDYGTWDAVEAEARDEWDDFSDGVDRTWEDIKDAARHAWETVTEPFDNDDDTYSFGNRNGSNANNGYTRYASDFRDHYNTNYAGSGNFFDYYEPGYRYGHYLATANKYDNYSNWDALETDARNEWRDAGNAVEHAWEDIKDAARHAWEVVSEPFDDDDDYDRSY